MAMGKSPLMARCRSSLVARSKSPPLVRRVDPERGPWAVTVAVPTSHRTAQGAPLKSARERMDIIPPTERWVLTVARLRSDIPV
jgi:hypothetical protein